MTESNHLCDLWEHTIVKDFQHDPKSELGLMLREWVIFNKLENFNSILNYTIDDFTPSVNLSYINEHCNILHQTPMHEDFNLRLYIQHLIDQNENEAEDPLSEENWMKQTNWKFIKHVIHHRHSMTPEQLKQKPFEEIFKKQHEKFDTEEGESNEEEQESTTSSEKSEQDSESDTSIQDEEASEPTQTFQTHNIVNETIHDEDDSSEESEEENMNEMQTYENNGEQNNAQEDKLLTTNFEVKGKNRKVEGS